MTVAVQQKGRERAAGSPSPADLAEQVRKQAFVDLEDARPLPAQCYTDPAFYALEVSRILQRDWIPVARLEQIPNAGDFVTVDLPDEPLMVVRGEDGVVRAMSRVCRHRYADVLADTQGAVPEAGCVQKFECPYHLWTYRLDGSLSKAIDFARREKFEATKFGLRQIRTEIWQGFVFVNLSDEPARPLGMDPLAKALGNYDMSNYKIVRTWDWGELGAGWKLVLENFMEFYHHIGAHKETLETAFPGLATDCADGTDGSAIYYAHNHVSAEVAAGEVDGHLQPPAMAPIPTELTPYERSIAFIAVRLPLFLITGGGSYNYWLQVTPTGPETHRLKVHALAPLSTLDQLTDEQHDTARHYFDAVQAEDAAVNARVQASMHSRHAFGGVFHEQEFPLLLLQRYLAEMLEEDARV